MSPVGRSSITRRRTSPLGPVVKVCVERARADRARYRRQCAPVGPGGFGALAQQLRHLRGSAQVGLGAFDRLLQLRQ